MAIASFLLALIAAVCWVVGLLTSIVPVVGSVFSFGAPALAIAGIVLGGKAMSRAQSRGAGTGLATAGVILNALTFLPATASAMTCGVCNACFSAATLSPGQGGQIRFDSQGWHFGSPDAGVRLVPPTQGATRPGSADPAQRNPGRSAPNPGPPREGAPPPAYPPPPLPSGNDSPRGAD